MTAWLALIWSCVMYKTVTPGNIAKNNSNINNTVRPALRTTRTNDVTRHVTRRWARTRQSSTSLFVAYSSYPRRAIHSFIHSFTDSPAVCMWAMRRLTSTTRRCNPHPTRHHFPRSDCSVRDALTPCGRSPSPPKACDTDAPPPPTLVCRKSSAMAEWTNFLHLVRTAKNTRCATV